MSTAESPPLTLRIDVKALRIGALLDLEEARTLKELTTWLVDHAGADLAELRELTFAELRTVVDTVSAQLATGLPPSKQNGAHS